MGDFPLMTEKGTFIYNGAERVVVTQLVRSPGPYYDKEIDKSGKNLFFTTVIPNRGAWLEYETCLLYTSFVKHLLQQYCLRRLQVLSQLQANLTRQRLLH